MPVRASVGRGAQGGVLDAAGGRVVRARVCNNLPKPPAQAVELGPLNGHGPGIGRKRHRDQPVPGVAGGAENGDCAGLLPGRTISWQTAGMHNSRPRLKFPVSDWHTLPFAARTPDTQAIRSLLGCTHTECIDLIDGVQSAEEC
jgi:hypothetical protein